MVDRLPPKHPPSPPVLFLTYRDSPHGHVKLFHDALLIIIGVSVLFQGILSEVRPMQYTMYNPIVDNFM